jgi:hypothetical protein
MPDARGREYGINPEGGPDELARVPNNEIVQDDNLGRTYAEPIHPPTAPELEPSTPAPAMVVEPEDVDKPAVKKASIRKAPKTS